MSLTEAPINLRTALGLGHFPASLQRASSLPPGIGLLRTPTAAKASSISRKATTTRPLKIRCSVSAWQLSQPRKTIWPKKKKIIYLTKNTRVTLELWALISENVRVFISAIFTATAILFEVSLEYHRSCRRSSPRVVFWLSHQSRAFGRHAPVSEDATCPALSFSLVELPVWNLQIAIQVTDP